MYWSQKKGTKSRTRVNKPPQNDKSSRKGIKVKKLESIRFGAILPDNHMTTIFNSTISTPHKMGIVTNTEKIISDAEFQKKGCEKLEKYCESLAEKMEIVSHSPIQPHPIVQKPIAALANSASPQCPKANCCA